MRWTVAGKRRREGKPERVIMDFGEKIFPTYFLRKSIREHKQGLSRYPTDYGSGPTEPHAMAGWGHQWQEWGMIIKIDNQLL